MRMNWFCCLLGLFLVGCISEVKEPSYRTTAMNYFRQVALSVHQYHQEHGEFPQDIKDADGKPLLSWRVHLLPMLERQDLYDQIRFDEPWDSPHNRQFHDQMPGSFSHPKARESGRAGLTVYLRPIHSSSVFGGQTVPTLEQINAADGTSSTLHLVEVPEKYAVPWMKPADFPVDREHGVRQLTQGNWSSPGFLAVFMDLHVAFLTEECTPEEFAGYLTWNGGESPPGELDGEGSNNE